MIAELKPYPAYKDSGVPWLGQVPKHWEVQTLGRIGRLSKGNGSSKADEVSEGMPCVRYGDLYTRHEFVIRKTKACVTPERAASYTTIRYGDVLFAASGETIEDIGRSAENLLDCEARCGGDVLLLRPTRIFEPGFLGYAADSPASRNQKACMGRGFTVVHIYASELKHLVLAVPPVGEQSAIVRFLGHADRQIRRYIAAKRKLIALLNEQKQAIIHRTVTRGLDPNVRLKPSGVEWLGDVPEDWEVVRIGRLVEITPGFAFKSDGFSQNETDIPLLRGINVSPGRIRWQSIVRWPRAESDQFRRFELGPGDVVLGMDRPIIASGMRVAMIQGEDLPALLLQRVARLRPRRHDLEREFLFFLIQDQDFADYLAPIFTGVSVPHISPEQIAAYRIALPPVEEQKSIVGWVGSRTKSLEVVVRRSEREIELIREYRTRLIADVVTGKLDVREAAAKLPEEADEPEPLEGIEEVEEGTDLTDEAHLEAEAEPAAA